MPWKKSPPELIAAFARVVPAGGGAERRPMFGYPAAFVNGNMFAGLHEERVVLRLDEDGIAEAKRQGATDFEPMPGRRMSGWVAVSGNLLADESLLRRWATRAFRHVSAMPPKSRKVAGRKGRQLTGTRSRPRAAGHSPRAS